MTRPNFTNRLIHETSPYLRQHAHNPVDWYPWGDEALRRAKELDRPIFLSIGYSACHWCHVMEYESFEDPEIGRILNDHFVSIKVDREERPDLDQIYMTAVQLLTSQGGWPMSMFLLPDCRPFFGGTYFPPTDRHGRPSFQRVLLTLVDYWQQRRPDLEKNATNLTTSVQANLQLDASEGSLSADLLTNAVATLRRAFDPRHGGFGRAPKFPHPMEIRLLLRLHRRFHDDAALSMARLTLDQMAMGGMYDQLGGGFHRYSTDAEWLVPHFEKMLYDNALLALAYLEAWQVTRSPLYREVAEETLNYVLREMTSPDGGFYSTQDADSEGVEGKFFVWTLAEVEDMLGPDEAKIFASVYDITPQGNWEGHNILRRLRSYEEDASRLGLDERQLRAWLDACKRTLLAVRRERIWPARDEKVLTAWNGLMIAAFAKAAQVLDNPAYSRAASRAADFVLKTMRRPNGQLYRTTFAGSQPKLNGYLDDYANLIDALVSLYETTFESHWLREAVSLAMVMIEQFSDEADGGFFYTAKDHEAFLLRCKDTHDNATPSGNAMAATGLLRLAKLTGRADLHQHAVRTLERFQGVLTQTPAAVGQMLLALDFHLGPVHEIAVVGAADNGELQQCLQLLRTTFRPNQVVAWKPHSDTPSEEAALLPLLANRSAAGSATVYICQDSVCQTPLVGVRALQSFLEAN